MDIEFDSIDDLYEFIQDDIEEVLLKDVAPQIKMIEQKVIDSVVYDVYEPKYYKRRYDYKGLSDLNNMEESIETYNGEIILSIENVAETANKLEDRTLDDIIENGVGSNRESTPQYAKPRKFTKETQRMVDGSSLVEDILRKKIDYID